MAQTWDVTLLSDVPDPVEYPTATGFPARLTITCTLPNGKEYRWSPDERDTEDVPSGLGFGTSIPGGFSTCTFSLPRGIVKDYPDEALFADVKITGAGGRVAWEGRVASLPREQGASRTLTVGAVGWSAHLKDHQAFREIYRHARLGDWQDISLTNRNTLLSGANLVSQGFNVDPDRTGSAALRTGWTTSAWGSSDKPISEAMLDTGGIPLGSLYYSWIRGYNADSASADHVWGAGVATDDSIAATDDTGTLRATGPGSGTLAATTSTRTVAYVYYYINAAGGVDNRPYDVFWDDLAVYGDHGLTKRGTEPNAGFYLSDIVADVIPRAAPLLNLGTIEQTSYVITHAAYQDPTDAESVILDANKYELKRWGVWENRAFDLWTGSPDTRTVWEARLSDGAQVQLEGDNTESVINGVVVRYQDPYGANRVIGPTGYTPADTTSASLLITDATNPATAAGIQRYAVLNLGFPTDASGAEQIGAVYLQEQQLPQRRGSISLTGLVRHPELGQVPAWMVRAGDFLRIADRPGDSPREVTSTQYQHDTHTVSCTVGGLPQTVDALLERVGVNALNL